MANLAKYVVSLEAQTAKYVAELDKANRKLDRFHKDQERAVEKIKSAFLSIGASLVAAFSVRAIAQFTKASIDAADEIGEISAAAGIGAEKLQELRFAFDELGGVANGQTDIGLQRFNRTLGLAINGSRQAQQQFKLLGLEFKDLGRGTDATLDAVLRSLGEIENDARRAAIAGRLFGEELGPKLAAALKGGVQALEDSQRRVTGIISDENVRKASALDDMFKRLAGTIGGPLKTAAIDAAFWIAKALGHVEEAPEDTLTRRIEQAKRELAELQISLNAPFREQYLSEEMRAEQDARARQLRENIQVLEAAAAAVEKPVKVDGLQDFNDGLEEISTSFGKLPAGIKQFDFAGASAMVLNTELQEVSDTLTKMPDDLKKLSPEFNSFAASLRAPLRDMQEAAAKAAQSIGQDFRSAFESWIMGAERSFRDLLERMAIQMATSALFKGLASLFPGGSFLSNFFGGFRAEGGPLNPGKWYIAGEKGPEPVWGGGSGAFAMPSMAGAGGVNVTYNIDARGATTELVQRLPQILAENNKRLKAEIRHERGRDR